MEKPDAGEGLRDLAAGCAVMRTVAQEVKSESLFKLFSATAYSLNPPMRTQNAERARITSRERISVHLRISCAQLCNVERKFLLRQSLRKMETEITVGDLKAERTWLIQHGVRELTTIGGLSLGGAVRQIEREIEKLNAEIRKMEGAR